MVHAGLINLCRDNIELFQVNEKEVQDLYYKWGGIPRYVLFQTHNVIQQNQPEVQL
ncbi:hypothetical protein C1645_785753, partial [Glomus cerebriforme]